MERAAPSCLRAMRSNQVWQSSQLSEDRAKPRIESYWVQQCVVGRTLASARILERQLHAGPRGEGIFHLAQRDRDCSGALRGNTACRGRTVNLIVSRGRRS
jgi:hypothetical protein